MVSRKSHYVLLSFVSKYKICFLIFESVYEELFLVHEEIILWSETVLYDPKRRNQHPKIKYH